jgi:hypothetical protein
MNATSTAEESKPLTLRDIEKDIKRTFVKGVIGVVLAGAIALVPFYYNTTLSINELFKTTETTSKNIEDLTKKVNTIDMKTEIANTKPEIFYKEIEELQKRNDRLEQKVDKMYEILIQMNNKK